MHTDLSPHLHSDKCNDLINELKKCHEEHVFGKFVGFCNTMDAAVTRCLKEERLKRRQQNYEKSLQMKASLKVLLEQDRKGAEVKS